MEIGSDEYLRTIDHRSRRAAALLLEQGHGAEVTALAWIYVRARSGWEVRGSRPGELRQIMDVIAASGRYAPVYAALPELWPQATFRVVDGAWDWICGTVPMPPMPDPQRMHPLDRLEQELEIERYQLLGSD